MRNMATRVLAGRWTWQVRAMKAVQTMATVGASSESRCQRWRSRRGAGFLAAAVYPSAGGTGRVMGGIFAMRWRGSARGGSGVLARLWPGKFSLGVDVAQRLRDEASGCDIRQAHSRSKLELNAEATRVAGRLCGPARETAKSPLAWRGCLRPRERDRGRGRCHRAC